MNGIRVLLVAAPLLASAAPAAAQQADVRARLEARGLPAQLSKRVAALAASAAEHGVPAGPLADKAIEGWAKHVPDARILTAVRAFADRMAVAADAVRAGGLGSPPGSVVAAAAEAMGGGLGADQVRAIVRASPSPVAAGPGLSVVAALTAQGLASSQAVAIVVGAMHSRRSVADLLDLPSVARALRDQGLSNTQVGQHILDGDGNGRDGGRGGEHPMGGIPRGDDGGGHDRASGPPQLTRSLVRGS